MLSKYDLVTQDDLAYVLSVYDIEFSCLMLFDLG